MYKPAVNKYDIIMYKYDIIHVQIRHSLEVLTLLMHAKGGLKNT